MSEIELKCLCGQVQGTLRSVNPKAGTRVKCYCKSCQEFANHLDKGNHILDERGGSDIYQVAPNRITITTGGEHVKCLRLTPKGLLRWYASCCNTPIANTVSAKFPFVGIISPFIPPTEANQKLLGPIKAHAYPQYAKERLPEVWLQQTSLFRYTIKILFKIGMWKISGKGRPTPFFSQDGRPITKPKILNPSPPS